MGGFSKDLRHKKIPGPNQRGFNRVEWEFLAKKSELDDEDRRLIISGLFFDDLLCSLRAQKALSEIPLKSSSKARYVIALATYNLFCLSQQAIPKTPSSGKSPLITSEILRTTVLTKTGQHFSPDEIITGMGDGMKHILRELQEFENDRTKLHEYDAEKIHVDQINAEFNKAICYQWAVECWLDCAGNGYGLAKHNKGIALVPFDKAREIARIVSTYRRLNIGMQDTMMFVEKWLHSWPRSLKEKLCGIPLVRNVSGQNRVEHIDLGLSKKVLDSASVGVAGQLWLQASYYRNLLDDPLSGLYDFTINEIVNGWRLLQSLAVAIFSKLEPIENDFALELLRFAPRIPKRILSGTFSRALGLTYKRAEMLVKVFVFDVEHPHELWLQPLVSCEEDYCIVIPCIHSVHLLRIVEGWMRQGNINLDRRGPEFEQFCREDLNLSLKDSPIKEAVKIPTQSVSFKPQGEREEEIDLVVIISDAVLIIEAKCILWPDESIQFANYRDVLEKAVGQILRKKDAVIRNYASFSDRLKVLGYNAPDRPNVVCCVLSNSAVYSGFPILGVPVIDLAILRSFLRNEHVKAELRHAGRSIQRHALKFYNDAADASLVLESYLIDPPQVSDTRQSVKLREVVFPVESPTFGKLIQQTYSVEIDTQQIR